MSPNGSSEHLVLVVHCPPFILSTVDELIAKHGLSVEDGMVMRSSTADDNPTMLHDLMFLPALKSTFDDEQQARWLPHAQVKRVGDG